MDFKKLIIRYRQFGGPKLVWEYARLGALWLAVKVGVRCLLKQESFKAIYPEVLRKIEPFIVKRYAPVLQSKMSEVRGKTFEHEHPKVIWWCWLQGLDAAPEIVKACFNSLKQLTGYSLVVIDNSNWREYVELPGYIVEKWEKRRIPAAMFSDLLRVELLIKYGGTWIDSTVLCTGFNTQMTQEAQNYLDSDLFLFQYTPRGTTNEVLMVLRDMLHAYWNDYDCTLDYYIFHFFFGMVAQEYPEQISRMPYGFSKHSIALMKHWGGTFNQEQWERLVSRVAFHKLSYRVSKDIKNNKDNFYNHVLSLYRH